MANSLNIDLTGKTVILRQSFFRRGLKATDHPFLCGGGFGASPHTSGRMLAGTFLSDGEQTAVSGYDVDRLATEEEAEAAVEAARALTTGDFLDAVMPTLEGGAV